MAVSDTEVVTINGASAAAKTVTAISGAAYSMTSWTMSDFVTLCTLLFILLQIGLLVPKYAQLFRAWRKGHKVRIDLK